MQSNFPVLLAGLSLFVAVAPGQAPAPLRSWNDTAPKKAIVAFVEKVTREGSPGFVPVAERIAIFDDDGTLWAEKPIYVQAAFAIDWLKALAPHHPEWKTTEPFASLLNEDIRAALAGGEKGLLPVMAAAHTGMTDSEFSKMVAGWIATARNPENARLHTEMVYQPMVELLEYLRANGFKAFIVSGGGADFLRPWVEKAYGIPPEQVVDNQDGKPEGIQRLIGRRPIAAFGNSDGDLEMLQWTTAGTAPRFGLLVHHDDAKREWAYDRQSDVGRLDKALDEAKPRSWTVVSMKDDWNCVFAFEKRESLFPIHNSDPSGTARRGLRQ